MRKVNISAEQNHHKQSEKPNWDETLTTPQMKGEFFLSKDPIQIRKKRQPTRKMDTEHEKNYLAHKHKIFITSSKKWCKLKWWNVSIHRIDKDQKVLYSTVAMRLQEVGNLFTLLVTV